MTTLLWLGAAAPLHTVRWLDGALAAAAAFEGAIAVAAGDPSWLDLAADRATRAGVATAGIVLEASLDYLGWAQVAAAAARHLGATTVLVDEASRPERFAETAAIADVLGAAQLTSVIALAPDGAVIHASRAGAGGLHTVRIRGAAVLGVRIAGPAIDEYPTPMPSAAMRRIAFSALGLDPAVLAHRTLAPRAPREPHRTVERVAEHLAVHVLPRQGR